MCSDAVTVSICTGSAHLLNGSLVLDDPALLAVVQLLHFALQVDHLLLQQRNKQKSSSLLVFYRLNTREGQSQGPEGHTQWHPVACWRTVWDYCRWHANCQAQICIINASLTRSPGCLLHRLIREDSWLDSEGHTPKVMVNISSAARAEWTHEERFFLKQSLQLHSHWHLKKKKNLTNFKT